MGLGCGLLFQRQSKILANPAHHYWGEGIEKRVKSKRLCRNTNSATAFPSRDYLTPNVRNLSHHFKAKSDEATEVFLLRSENQQRTHFFQGYPQGECGRKVEMAAQ